MDPEHNVVEPLLDILGVVMLLVVMAAAVLVALQPPALVTVTV